MELQKHHANAAFAIAHGMEAAAKHGVPDKIVADELVRIALATLGAHNGGPQNLPAVLRRMANEMERQPERLN